MATTNVTIRMDKDLKTEADNLFAALGLNMSTAIGVFCRQAVRLGKIPFELAVDEPNIETIQAIKEVEYMKQHPDEFKGYADVDEMMRELLT